MAPCDCHMRTTAKQTSAHIQICAPVSVIQPFVIVLDANVIRRLETNATTSPARVAWDVPCARTDTSEPDRGIQFWSPSVVRAI